MRSYDCARMMSADLPSRNFMCSAASRSSSARARSRRTCSDLSDDSRRSSMTKKKRTSCSFVPYHFPFDSIGQSPASAGLERPRHDGRPPRRGNSVSCTRGTPIGRRAEVRISQNGRADLRAKGTMHTLPTSAKLQRSMRFSLTKTCPLQASPAATSETGGGKQNAAFPLCGNVPP